MWGALQTTYGPAHVCSRMDKFYVQKFAAEGAEEVWLPRGASHDILPGLLSIGCVPADKANRRRFCGYCHPAE